MATEGTKDVSQAQIRTDMAAADTLLLVNGITKEVQQVPIANLAEQIAPNLTGAPAEYDDFFGI
ncbi:MULTISPECIES: hypothetical protein [Sphingobacterium]|uniref:hypothetical protein n=1 Tax=Sphingobacterium TaxID=28453 RepID=UPI00257D88DF|nr:MULTISPECIES: hypothetical protein [Sphingobacterium]